MGSTFNEFWIGGKTLPLVAPVPHGILQRPVLGDQRRILPLVLADRPDLRREHVEDACNDQSTDKKPKPPKTFRILSQTRHRPPPPEWRTTLGQRHRQPMHLSCSEYAPYNRSCHGKSNLRRIPKDPPDNRIATQIAPP